jgi:hypothetical protein
VEVITPTERAIQTPFLSDKRQQQLHPHLWARRAQVSETFCAVLNTILYNEKRKKYRSPE